MNHLTSDELVDAVEGTLDSLRQGHLQTCAMCRQEVGQLSAILRVARAAEIPEPSPLFWERFSARVHEAIAEEAQPRYRWAPEWLRPAVLVPLGALALIVMALVVSVPRGPIAPQARVEPAPPDGTAVDEPEWAALSQIVGPVDIENAHAMGIVVKPGDVERAALDLSAAQQRELVRLLKEEIDKGGG